MSRVAARSTLILAGRSIQPADPMPQVHIADMSTSASEASDGLLLVSSVIIAAAGIPTEQEKPVWDARSRRLMYRGILVKAVRRDADNQQIVLNALQNSGWPAWIADPLPPGGDVDVRDRIYNTVKRLNLQHYPLLEFCADGHGTGVCWNAFE